MTKFETFDPDIIPGFDVLEWKREVQEQIYHETKGMTTDEFLKYVREGSKEFRQEQRLRRAELAQLAESGSLTSPLPEQ